MDKSDFFSPDREIIIASAPGRLDVMGGIADYSGSLLLQKPIRQRTFVHLQKRGDTLLRMFSADAEQSQPDPLVEIDLSQLNPGKQAIDYQALRAEIINRFGSPWCLYVAGCFILCIENNTIPPQGADIYIESDVPIGKGVSSSAALEVAVLMAMEKAFDFSLGKYDLPLLAQKVENLIVGAPCGLMDQLSTYLGEEDKLLPIICQPVEVFDPIPIPDKIHFPAIDSGVKHSVAGHAYGEARTAAFMGYTLIAMKEGCTIKDLRNARDTADGSGLPFKGYLANIEKAVFDDAYAAALPETMSGRDFLDQYGIIIDPVTRVRPEIEYRVKACATHPVHENHRIGHFRDLLLDHGLSESIPEQILISMGECMVDSHRSYSACGLGNEATDDLVQRTMNAGPEAGLYGARITGGGCGGTVCLMAYMEKGIASANDLHKQYMKASNREVIFFT